MDTIGARVRAKRGRLLLSQEELAARAGVQKLTITRIEGERVAHPQGRTVRRLATALGVDPYWLLHGDDATAAGGAR